MSVRKTKQLLFLPGKKVGGAGGEAGVLLRDPPDSLQVCVKSTGVLHSRNAHVREGIRLANGVMSIINPVTH